MSGRSWHVSPELVSPFLLLLCLLPPLKDGKGKPTFPILHPAGNRPGGQPASRQMDLGELFYLLIMDFEPLSILGDRTQTVNQRLLLHNKHPPACRLVVDAARQRSRRAWNTFGRGGDYTG